MTNDRLFRNGDHIFGGGGLAFPPYKSESRPSAERLAVLEPFFAELLGARVVLDEYAPRRHDDTGPGDIRVDVDDHFTAVVVLHAKTGGVQGWSYAIRHDGDFLSIPGDPCTTTESAFICGTDADSARVAPNFNVSRPNIPCEPDGPHGSCRPSSFRSSLPPLSISVETPSRRFRIKSSRDLPRRGRCFAFSTELCAIRTHRRWRSTSRSMGTRSCRARSSTEECCRASSETRGTVPMATTTMREVPAR